MVNITNDIYYVGVNDHDIQLFENQYHVPHGMAYNSYVIIDEKIAVMDSVEKHYGEEWLNHIHSVLQDRKPDYLIVQHMEPDHSANIKRFLEVYPDATIVTNSKAFVMIDQFFDFENKDNRLVVNNGDELNLGSHTLKFTLTPMVHWPEVMMTYDMKDKVLFSADAFGKFGALDHEEDWDDEARRYYIGIVGKYGMQVQMALKKLLAFDIQIICSLHGPVLKDHLDHYIDLYQTWSSYKVETEGIVVAYTSVYGHTKEAVDYLVEELHQQNQTVIVHDLSQDDMSLCVSDAFRYGKLVLASTTYNADVFPYMKEYIHHLVERNYQNRTIAFIENGSWAPMAMKVMKGMLESCKNIAYTEQNITIKSAMKESTKEDIHRLVEELCD